MSGGGQEPGLGGGGLYSEVKCIMGNGDMGTATPGNNMTDTTENIPFQYLPATSLAGGNNGAEYACTVSLTYF